MYGWVGTKAAAARAWIGKSRKAINRRANRFGLLPAVVSALVAGVLVAYVAYQVVFRYTPTSDAKAAPIDITKVALTIVAGVGGVVALVIAYRRQRDTEQSRFVERFGAAAAQLGATDVAVRIAGVYAMAGAADESDGLRRQQCIDVLCGYLRLPYTPDIGGNHQTKDIRKYPATDSSGPESEEHFEYRQNDREVRKTIVRVVADHLRPEAEYSWSASNFDFRTAHLEDVDLTRITFSGTAWFDGATFSGPARFDRATFGGFARFNGSTFSDGAYFDMAKFCDGAGFNLATFGGVAGFDWATFGGTAWFDEATFSDIAWFDQATFNTARFNVATFNGEARFHRATVSGTAEFDRVTFGGVAWFDWATFGGDVRFSRSTFNNTAWFGEVTFSKASRFDRATFSDTARFDRSTFSDIAQYDGVTFSGAAMFEKVTFSDAAMFEKVTFSDAARFNSATFSGSATFAMVKFASSTSFLAVDFGSNKIEFTTPQQWGPPPPEFDWNDDGTGKPGNIEPQSWPPIAAAS
ncbi:pentapeptide repeat-containing protein [Nocardia salmonicida]|uniref:pentapeptide repeat-containing protein n=1 Tax=Nocardia salmonicida TaxID=53431 RepID=UPI0033EFF8A8